VWPLRPDWKAAARKGLHRMRLLEAAYRARDLWRSASYRGRSAPPAADGLPVPPPDLMLLVAGTPEASWFLLGGERAAASIRSTLARNGIDLDSVRSILDFGCGCGRVVRHWRTLGAQVHGSDMNRRLVRWCRRHLPFATFETNGPRPPLPYAAGRFDLVYALSVFTHLPEPMQRPWLEELHRVTAPGGHVLFSVHGERYLPELTPEERQRFQSGHLVVRGADVPGRNACGAYHPASYVREHLARGWQLLDHVAEGAAGNPHQDLVLLRKVSPAAGSTPHSAAI
jgi:2-polyprenyl-3-methyl-5-hydroxy-6-metoxy-1,4-benzoquinol methylase